MIVIDVNVVLAAHRGDHPLHAPVRRWFDDLVSGGTDFGIPLLVWGSFLRLATNRRIFGVPTPLGEAFDFIEAVRAQPGHVPVEPGDRHLTLLRRISTDAAAQGDLVPDALLAAIAIENGADIASLDRDFARFPGLVILRPDRV